MSPMPRTAEDLDRLRDERDALDRLHEERDHYSDALAKIADERDRYRDALDELAHERDQYRQALARALDRLRPETRERLMREHMVGLKVYGAGDPT